MFRKVTIYEFFKMPQETQLKAPLVLIASEIINRQLHSSAISPDAQEWANTMGCCDLIEDACRPLHNGRSRPVGRIGAAADGAAQTITKTLIAIAGQANFCAPKKRELMLSHFINCRIHWRVRCAQKSHWPLCVCKGSCISTPRVPTWCNMAGARVCFISTRAA